MSHSSEHSHTESGQSPTRSSAPKSTPSSQSVSRPRVRATARISVPLPVRETFTIPRRDEAGPSRPRSRRVSPPPPQIEEPAGRPIGMTALEGLWVSGLSQDAEMFRTRLDHYSQSLDKLMGMMSTNDQTMSGVLTMLADSRMANQKIYICLAILFGMLVVILGWFVLLFMR